MEVKYVSHMGDDLQIVNAARVSFAKKHESFTDGDIGLIKYLASHGHWSPFGHTAITLHIKAPIFIARQLGKHQVGLVWNEVSRRYVDSDPEFYSPDVWRKRAENVKQGSSDESVEFHTDTKLDYLAYLDECKRMYNNLLSLDVAPEQARMMLPQSMYTEWYWTGNLYAFANVYNKRIDPHAQKEVQEVAKQIGEVIAPLFPVSWEALTK